MNIQPLPLDLLTPAMDLVWRVFLEFEAPDYAPQGVETFQEFIQPESIRPKLESGAMQMWCCLEGTEPVGVLALRDGSHISLLFVDPRHHRRGIARRMVEVALAHRAERGEPQTLTVNSSPYAVEAYRHMGFFATGREQQADGLRFTPMLRRGPISFGILGSGWRSEFYLRIARALPHMFSVSSMLFRGKEKAADFARRFGIPTTTSRGEFFASRPEFVVVAVSKDGICEQSLDCLDRGMPVLAETPAGVEEDQLHHLWERHLGGQKLQIAEQYFLYPTLEAKQRILAEGLLGEPDTIFINTVHDYHAVSLVRRFLGTGMEEVSLSGERFSYPLVENGSRGGLITSGRLTRQRRDRLTLRFAGGTRAFYDFTGEQYHSHIRTRHLAVQGPRGELWDDGLLWLDGENHPREGKLEIAAGTRGGIEQISFEGNICYRNPFPGSGLTEDETAIARCLLGMAFYLETGREFYPLAEALEDAYVSLLMHRALEQPGAVVESAARPWVQGKRD